ncbi:hypothetical protein BDDG_03707 [Blastomyces dermatitidis ATCC 18188]|uniref:Uncharacterized protein n=1 Tax=Ajellomyces dermatitidis (strain ATCC 18188 / CBS 674.68) TaxID=653446 RepID=F2TC03_AJEDA|nr:hypothetical protein BDDG_03707 [Blastomyces dermatitidis ATCC 18188]
MLGWEEVNGMVWRAPVKGLGYPICDLMGMDGKNKQEARRPLSKVVLQVMTGGIYAILQDKPPINNGNQRRLSVRYSQRRKYGKMGNWQLAAGNWQLDGWMDGWSE